jgi:hypothetical protein
MWWCIAGVHGLRVIATHSRQGVRLHSWVYRQGEGLLGTGVFPTRARQPPAPSKRAAAERSTAPVPRGSAQPPARPAGTLTPARPPLRRLLRHRIMRQCAEWLRQAERLDVLSQRRLRDAVAELHAALARL